MKASTTIIFLMFFQHLLLQAQDFKLFVPGQEKQYYRDGDRIYSPNINSIEQKEDYINVGFDEIALKDYWSKCIYNGHHDILGSEVASFESGHQGIVIFGTQPIPVFQIRSYAEVGDSWLFIDFNGYRRHATCKSIQPELVNGQMELVKTIEFDYYCDLKISQHQGIISTPTWNRLDLHWRDKILYDDDRVDCVKRIWDEELLEKFNNPFGDLAADLHPGDELHIEESYSLTPTEESIKRIKARFLEKTFDTTSNSYHLSFRQEVDEWKNMDGQLSQSTYIDTAVSIIGRHLLLDSRQLDYPIPMRTIIDVEDEREFLRYSFFNGKLMLDKAQLDVDSSVVEPFCFPLIYEVDEGHQFIEGLAGPYYKHYSVYPNERSLKYYKKGDEEWGDPFTFTVSAKDRSTIQTLSISPNPVQSGELIYFGDGLASEFEIHLIDLHGRVIQSGINDLGNFRINSGILPGIYIIVAQNKQNELLRTKLFIW